MKNSPESENVPVYRRHLALMGHLSETEVACAIAGFTRIDTEGRPWASAQEAEIMIDDPIVEEVRRVRAELVERYGGLVGWIEHLQEMDRRRLRRSNQRAKKASPKSPGQPPRVHSKISR